jgi:exopolyphosphatase/guanosine-5'-triphosphate,3'-diphosphate pyrophosphatase
MPKKQPESVAVVDIGSNSVRLVIFRLTAKGHEIIREKKATCGLARRMTRDNPRLDRTGMILTLRALRKFNKLLAVHKPRKVLAIGTAAMRAVARTKKGKAFHRHAEQALGHKIKIVSGIMEARLTAYGVMSALPKAAGVCGDLGGGSLELASINRGRIGHTATLALGSLTLKSESGGSAAKAEKLMRSRLHVLPWLGRQHGKTFYPIGGSWRAVARVMMRKQGHRKLRRVQGYAIAASTAQKFAAAIAQQKSVGFRKMHKKIRQRADIIPFAAAVLCEIIAIMRPKRIVFSSHGVREGLMRRYEEKVRN